MKHLMVILIGYAVCASDDCAAESRGPVNCYECSTVNHEYYCGDPFNSTAPGLRTVQCKEACAKWLRKPKFGPTHVIRTCASTLNIKMQWSHVCMKESRPGDGRLCFCNDDHCNSATNLQTKRFLELLWLSVATLVFIQYCTTGYLNPVEWWTESVTSSVCVVSKLMTISVGLSGFVAMQGLQWINGCRLRKEDTKDSSPG